MRIILIIAVCLMPLCLLAQDPHFSQFFSSPLTLNPAFTGKFDGTVRIAGNYRNQWPTINRAYQTATVSVDLPIMENGIRENDIWGIGFMGYTDKSANGAVKFNFFSASTAYNIGLDEDGYHQIGAGFQATYANMMINTSELKFEDQLTTSGFTGVTSEVFNGSTLKNNYVDVNAGILYSGSNTDKDHYYAGVSMYHINRPKQQFTGALYLLNPRTTFHAGGYFPVGENGFLHLSGLTSIQAKASETVIGGAFQLQAGTATMINPINLYAGAWLRFNDAIIPYFGIEINDARLGITYDVNTSKLKSASSSQGGIEISLIYINRPSDRKTVRCPRF